ncbi:ATP phosphoribosyltransferase [Raineyella fluvialis]|nr:ATP phosphoribosyltransferase [Raineyella fluvialis]
MNSERPFLKVAVPNKGSLSEASMQMLREAGYRQRSDSKELMVVDEANRVEFYYLRPRDIAIYVGEGTLDIGFTGRDMLLDSGAAATEIKALGFGGTRFRFAAPNEAAMTVDQLDGKRIATSYVGLVKAWLDERSMSARLISLDGAVENSVRLGVADVIADVVETGSTLKRAGLSVFGEPILHSEAILVQRNGDVPEGLEHFVQRIEGVLVARAYVLMDYDVSEDKLEAALALTPGFESPTVSELARKGWFAVRAMVPADDAHLVMDDLWDLGARAILVTDLAACRL